MKRITIILMVAILTICSTLGVSANDMVGNQYQIDGITVVFDVDSKFSDQQQEMIANLLVHPENGVALANLICNIFGHKNTTEGVTTITHKVSATDPRCLRELFTVTICSRCDESTVERNAAYYIPCCPED